MLCVEISQSIEVLWGKGVKSWKLPTFELEK